MQKKQKEHPHGYPFYIVNKSDYASCRTYIPTISF